MAYSMTGIGRASGDIKDPLMKFDVEIRSYNHRFLDISIKLPSCLQPCETDIRREVQSVVTRGHVVVVIQQDREVLATKIEVDRTLLKSYLKLADELRETQGISGEVDINTLLLIPGLIKFSQPQTESESIYKEFNTILKRALKNLMQMKQEEGSNIARELSDSIKKIEKYLRETESTIQERDAYYKEHLLSIIKPVQKELNEDRLYQELLYIAERTDVTEECKRLGSHLQLFKDALKDENHPGRKLNFLLQEMQREANTLSVKANYLQISKTVVKIKEEIEKIREQVQNLE
ncbi:MAG: YicC family protein [candidate division WOR-3 bacterium]|nr:MAG: YicC family protein [candidate division WOR-3 bacterium]